MLKDLSHSKMVESWNKEWDKTNSQKEQGSNKKPNSPNFSWWPKIPKRKDWASKHIKLDMDQIKKHKRIGLDNIGDLTHK